MVVWLALVNVRDVQLDDRAVEHLQGVEDRQRSKGECGWIDDDAGRAVDRLMDPADDLGLAVRLPEFERVGARRLAAIALDISQGRLAVDFRLALAQAIEVWAIQNVNRLHFHTFSLCIPTPLAATGSNPARP